jgi:hypothetical protein
MNRRNTLMLTGITVMGLIVALTPGGFAQSDPLAGLWQLNLAKSEYRPGPPPKSQTVYIQGDGQNRKVAGVGISGAGNAQSFVFSELSKMGSLMR